MEKRLTRLLEQFYGERRVQFGVSVVLGVNVVIPDVLVLLNDYPVLREGLLNEPPMLCVEVISPPERPEHALARCARYREAGIPYSWVVDPAERKAWEYAGQQPAPREVTKMFSGPCSIRLRDVFTE